MYVHKQWKMCKRSLRKATTLTENKKVFCFFEWVTHARRSRNLVMTAQKAVSVWIVVNIWCCWERGRERETTVLHIKSYRKMETNIFCETSVHRKAISFIIVANATATAAVVTLTNEWQSKTIYWANHSREWIPYIGKHEPFMGKYLQVIESGEYAIGLELLSTVSNIY